ncbi:MAG: flagellar biosynthetic protein FliO, partial [Methylococcales bacterium]|nr:flagellar biosynthetic protein FliO [Methylococcales bacterium]
IFLLRKANKFSVTGSGKMTVLGGLSLGMREKVILLQVGKKQLILGVTPGRIETLHVLEGEDCLNNDHQQPLAGEASSFSQMFKLAMKGNTNA